MTNNKFWLVRGSNIERQHNKKEEAEYSARRLAEEHELTFGVFELVSTFEGKATKTVNVIETSFEATPEESSEVKPKFKIGDIVNINAIGFKGSQFEITYSSKHKGIESYYYSVKDIENQDERSHGINEMYVTLVE